MVLSICGQVTDFLRSFSNYKIIKVLFGIIIDELYLFENGFSGSLFRCDILCVGTPATRILAPLYAQIIGVVDIGKLMFPTQF